jgi:hypothetical protein
MTIDQRNAGASITPIDGQFTVDRWKCVLTAASKYSAQQNAGAVTPPVGFTNYLGITSLTALASSATDFFVIRQSVEGFNTADLSFGTANAQAVTLSFWVRSSLTGTFGGSAFNSAGNRTYVFSYTISAANTWEYKTVTIAGDTTGTWLTNSSAGISVDFALTVGSNFTRSAGSWSTSGFAPTGAVSVLGTSGATWQVTGVQLEKGSTATPFEFRSIGTEQELCERYCETISFGGAGGIAIATSNYGSGTSPVTFVPFKTKKRATPTVALSGVSAVRYVTNTGVYTGATPSANSISVDGFTLTCNSSPAASFGFMDGMGNCLITSEL